MKEEGGTDGGAGVRVRGEGDEKVVGNADGGREGGGRGE